MQYGGRPPSPGRSAPAGVLAAGTGAASLPPDPRASSPAAPWNNIIIPGLEPAPVPRSVRTFAEVLANDPSHSTSKIYSNAFRHPLPVSFDNIHEGKLLPGELVGIKHAITMKGMPCIYLSNHELDLLSKPLDLTLVGKFPAGRPKWTSLQQYYRDLKLLGDYRLQHLDSKHIILHFTNPTDYISVFSRTIVNIRGHTLKYLKWSKEFDVNLEPSVTPIWISMPMLCMNLFTQNIIYSIAEVFGKPLLLDTPTAMGAKPGIVRVLVEMDLLIEHPSEVLLGNEEFSYAQEVQIERKPRYCAFCIKYGHVEEDCYVKEPGRINEKIPGNKTKAPEQIQVANPTPPPPANLDQSCLKNLKVLSLAAPISVVM